VLPYEAVRAASDPDELLLAFLHSTFDAAARLAKFQVPRLWEFRDALPKTPIGKVLRRELRTAAPGSVPR